MGIWGTVCGSYLRGKCDSSVLLGKAYDCIQLSFTCRGWQGHMEPDGDWHIHSQQGSQPAGEASFSWGYLYVLTTCGPHPQNKRPREVCVLLVVETRASCQEAS